MSAAHALLLAIAALSIGLMLGRPRGWPEVVWVGSGAVLLVALRLVPVRLAAHAMAEGTDVYLFLIGMMLLSELARAHGVFEWVSAQAVLHARGSPGRLFTLVYGIGTLVTIFLSNDATAVVLTPAVLAVAKQAKAEPRPHLFACALIANAASFALPISNPANLVVFRQGMPPLGRWLLSFSLPSLASVLATYLILRLLFRKQLRGEVESSRELAPLRPEGRLVLLGLGLVVAALLTASAFHRDLGLPTCLAALAVTGLISARAQNNPLGLAKHISWSTLLLVAALFVLVDAVESAGALTLTVNALRRAASLSPAPGAVLTAGAVGVANNLVNNLPLGLLAGATLQAAHTGGLLANIVLIGVDLGPNLSLTGSLATILWLLALRREDVHISALDFLKVGAVAMPAALLAAVAATSLP